MAALATVIDKRWVGSESHSQEPAVDSLLRHARLTGLPTKAWKTKRGERQYNLRLRGLDEIWRDFVEYFKLITLQKISSWQQRNHSNRENRPKERNFFRTLSKKGNKMSFFPSLLFWNDNEKSLKKNITKLQSVLRQCPTYNIQALSEIRRQNRCLKTRYLKTNFNIKNGYLSTSDSRWKKGYTCRDVSLSPHERLKTVLYHPECNHIFNGRLEK